MESGTEYSTRIPCSTETSDVIAHEKFQNSSTKPRLFWKTKVGEPSIAYDKVPFMMYGQVCLPFSFKNYFSKLCLFV